MKMVYFMVDEAGSPVRFGVQTRSGKEANDAFLFAGGVLWMSPVSARASAGGYRVDTAS